MDNLKKYFCIEIIDKDEYKKRLEEEIKLLEEMDFLWFIKRVVEIFNNHIKKYPSLLRGSGGCSLLLYYLGINQIDPIKYSIPLSRFINKLRVGMPDIDFDIPSSIKNQLFEDILLSNKDTIRMTSDVNKNNNEFFDDLIKEDPTIALVHNSALIIYSKKQENIILNNKITETQIKLTKNNIQEYNLCKIDLLGNSALDQLYCIDKTKKITDYFFKDEQLFKFIIKDDGIGITHAETPKIQNVIKILKPSNIKQLSICLAIVRPFANYIINDNINWINIKNEIIYDDDFILYLVKKLNYNFDKADEIRRLFKSKSDKFKIDEFINYIDLSELKLEEKTKLKNILNKLPKYSFCKAHSINYARMVYCLYWNKFYNKKEFWITTIKNIKGYYKDWVYIRKGLDNGLNFKGIENCNSFYHYLYTGYWLNKNFMTRCYLTNTNAIEQNIIEKTEHIEYEFRGLIAGTSNTNNTNNNCQMIITIGYDNNKFINLHLNKNRDLSKYKQVMGKGYLINAITPYIVIRNILLL